MRTVAHDVSSYIVYRARLASTELSKYVVGSRATRPGDSRFICGSRVLILLVFAPLRTAMGMPATPRQPLLSFGIWNQVQSHSPQ